MKSVKKQTNKDVNIITTEKNIFLNIKYMCIHAYTYTPHVHTPKSKRLHLKVYKIHGETGTESVIRMLYNKEEIC